MLVIHENWAKPGSFRGDPQRPTVRILKGYIPTAIEKIETQHAVISKPEMYIAGDNMIVLGNYGNMNLSIYSIKGKLLHRYSKGALRVETVQKDISRLLPGTYIYNFSNNKSVKYAGKFMITK
jgi:hypothetical protein